MPEDSLEKLHHLYHMADKEPFLLPKNYLQADVQLKDYIAPASFNFKSKYIEVGSCYSSVMFVKRFSYECDDEFITDLLDNTYDIAVSKHLVRMDKTESMKIMKRQMNDLEAAFAIYIYVAADTLEQLNDLKDYIKQVALRHQVIVDVLTGVPQQELGLKSIMPFANPSKTKDGSYLGQPFYLPTDEVGNLIPFSYRNNINPAGLFYGINLITNMPIIIDRTDELNANGFVIGTSGSGKSVTTKAEFFAAVMKYANDVFIIIDPENEYSSLATGKNGEKPPFDAEIIKLSPNTKTFINIFDTDLTYSEDGASAIQIKIDTVLTFCETIKGSALTAKERSVIDRCTKIIFKDFIASNGDRSKLPTLADFYKALIALPTATEASCLPSLISTRLLLSRKKRKPPTLRFHLKPMS